MSAFRLPEEDDTKMSGAATPAPVKERPLGLKGLEPAALRRAAPSKKLRPKSTGYSAALISKAMVSEGLGSPQRPTSSISSTVGPTSPPLSPSSSSTWKPSSSSSSSFPATPTSPPSSPSRHSARRRSTSQAIEASSLGSARSLVSPRERTLKSESDVKKREARKKTSGEESPRRKTKASRAEVVPSGATKEGGESLCMVKSSDGIPMDWRVGRRKDAVPAATPSSSPSESFPKLARAKESRNRSSSRSEPERISVRGPLGSSLSPRDGEDTTEPTSEKSDLHSSGFIDLGLGSSVHVVTPSQLPQRLLDIKEVLGSDQAKTSELSGMDKALQNLEWKKKALASIPEIKDLRERLYPLGRAVTFTQAYKPKFNKRIDEDLTRSLMLELVLQHLDYLGFSDSLRVLQREAQIRYTSMPAGKSFLWHHLKNAIKEVDETYDLAIGDRSTDPSEVHIEEHLYQMGLGQEQDEDLEEGNIWDEDLYSEDTVLYMEVDAGKDAKMSRVSMAIHVQPQLPTGDSVSNREPLQEIKAASFNRIILALTDERFVDPNFLKMSLMTYHSFTTPETLFAKLRERYDVPPPSEDHDDEEAWAEAKRAVQIRVVNVMKKWIEEYYDDFTEGIRRTLHDWIAHMAITQKIHADALTSSLRKATKQRDVELKVTRATPPEPIIPRNIWSNTLDVFDISPLELARQICLMEMAVFRAIKPAELMNQSWNKPKLKWRAPNVLKLISMFNHFSQGVAVSIVKCPTLRQRSKRYVHFIHLIENLRALNNFNSIMGILAAFNSSAVYRLHFTRAAATPQQLEVIREAEEVMSSVGSFGKYRNTLATANPPAIPYLGVHLTDLTFIDENPDFMDGPGGRKLINMAKRRLLYSVISKIQQFQQKVYDLQPVYQIQQAIRNMSAASYDESQLFELSLLREPRNATREEIQ